MFKQNDDIKVYLSHCCHTCRRLNFRSGRAVAVSIGGDHRRAIDLTTSDSRHVAGTLGRALAVGGLTVTVLQSCGVGISSGALRPGHDQSIRLTVHLSGDVCGRARHWGDK